MAGTRTRLVHEFANPSLFIIPLFFRQFDMEDSNHA